MNSKLKAYKRKLPINVSNNSIYEFIANRIKSKDNIIKIIFDISNQICLINIKNTLEKTINLLAENKLIFLDDIWIIEFKRKLKKRELEDSIVTGIESEFYSLFLLHLYLNEYHKRRTGKELMVIDYKINQKQLFHNKEEIQNEFIKGEKKQRINEIEKLPLQEQKNQFLLLIKEFETNQFLNNYNTHKSSIKFFKNSIKHLNEELKVNKSKTTTPLEKIWLPEAKISIEDLLTKGVKKGIWNEENIIITKRNSPYGTGKVLLGSLSVVLRGWAISKNLDYKEVGEAFCKMFNIDIDIKTNRPYKSFESGNAKYMKELKREFNINQ
jgi:hypothetical protein